MVWIGLISYPLYLWHWPLLVFGAIIKFGPLTLLERELDTARERAAGLGDLSVCRETVPFRPPEPAQDVQPRRRHGDGRGRRRAPSFGGAASTSGLPPEIRAMASVPTREAQAGGFMNACSISAMKRRLPIVASSAIGARWS